MENTIEKFINTSIFQDIIQYVDDYGYEWRVVKDNYNHLFYRKENDSFIHDGFLCTKTKSIEYLHHEYIEKVHREHDRGEYSDYIENIDREYDANSEEPT